MSLAGVAAKMRAEFALETEDIVRAFEEDPDFTLRERLEKLATEWESLGDEESRAKGFAPPLYYEAQKLRALLNPPKKEDE
jgi:hypothetical protein